MEKQGRDCVTGPEIEDKIRRLDPQVAGELGQVSDRVVEALEDPEIRTAAAEALHAWREAFAGLACRVGLGDRSSDDPTLIAVTLIAITLWAG